MNEYIDKRYARNSLVAYLNPKMEFTVLFTSPWRYPSDTTWLYINDVIIRGGTIETKNPIVTSQLGFIDIDAVSPINAVFQHN